MLKSLGNDGVLSPSLEVKAVEGLESSIPVPKVVVSVGEMEITTPVSEAIILEAGGLDQEELVVSTVEPAVQTSEEGADLIEEGPLLGENVILEAKMDIPVPSPKVIVPIAASNE